MSAADPSMSSTIRFGVVCSEGGPSGWHADCVSQLLALQGTSLELVLQSPRSPRRRSRLSNRLMRRLFGQEAATPVDLEQAVTVHLARDSGGGLDRTAAAALIRQREVDLVLDFSGLTHPPVAAGSRYGTWRFHVGAAGCVPGEPGLVEIVEGKPVTRVALEAEIADTTVVLAEAHLRTIGDSHVENRGQIRRAWALLAVRSVRQLLSGFDLTSRAPATTSTTRRTALTTPLTVSLVARLVVNRLRRRFRSVFRHETWNVGWVDQPIEAFLTSGEVKRVEWLAELPRSFYVADPFPVDGPDPLMMLAEVFDHRTGRGSIRSLSGSEGGGHVHRVPAVFDIAGHASYPFTFSHDGVLYCTPELGGERVVRLFRCEDPQSGWNMVGDLLTDVAAIDPTVFAHGDYWWLFFTDADVDPDASLNAWYAESLEGPWRPHAANPIKTDIRSSRPAGTPFSHEGRLYRPAQDVSRTYGGAVAVNCVHDLTPGTFREEVVSIVRPATNGPYPHGLHTLSAAGDLTLIDGKRLRFIPQALFRKARVRWLRRR